MNKKQLIAALSAYFSDTIPFNKLLGIQILDASAQRVVLQIDMRPELVGNTFYSILHGGVTSALLDTAGGLVAMMNTIEHLADEDKASLQHKLGKVGTIDLRVDFLRPGRGQTFTTTSEVVRYGNKIAVTRMLLKNEHDEEIAFGVATYLVG